MFTRRVNVFALLLLVVAAAELAWSQESRGTILGRITDASGSVVPGANVQVANKATGVTVPGSSNEDGNYFFPYLIPGVYQITVEKAGFKRSVRDGIQVNINDRLEINIQMELG